MKRSRLIPLLDFIPRATKRFARPVHLAPVTALLERTRREAVRAVVSAPPRHAKTETLSHAAPWRLLEDPSLRIGYVSYSQRFAEKRSARMRAIAGRVGIQCDPSSASKADWRTTSEEGGLWANSVDGSLLGEGFDLLLVDDPHKDRAEAESQLLRDRVYDWFTGVAFTRLEPGGSCIVFMARWHEDDLAGRLIKDGWENVVLPALDGEGNALWPERWPADKLREIEETIGAYSWASLYQGQPLPRGGALFRDVRFYDELPPTFRIGKGIDLAYSAKTRADKSASVVLLENGGLYYVADVRTAQVQVPEFLRVLAAVDASYPGPWHWYTSTTEAGLAHLATAVGGVTVIPERAAADKFTRSQTSAAAWNAGRVLVPRSAPWLDSFLSEVMSFTGAGDRHDDQVDALASAFARLGGAISLGQHTTQAVPRLIRTHFGQGIGGGGFQPWSALNGEVERAPRMPARPAIIGIPSSPFGGGGGRGWGSGGGGGWGAGGGVL